MRTKVNAAEPSALRLLAVASVRPLAAAAIVAAVPGLLRFDVVAYILGLGAWTLAEAKVEASSARRITAQSAIDLGSRAGLVLVHLVSWIAPLPELVISHRPPSALWATLGLALIATGGMLRLAALRTLGGRHTRALKIVEGQVLCRTGIYSVLRHPSYVGLILLNLAPCVTVRSPVAFLLVLVASVCSTAYRVRLEEGALRSAWGEEYLRYAAEVPAFFPGGSSVTRRAPL